MRLKAQAREGEIERLELMAGRLVGLVALIIGVIAACAEYYWGDHWLYVNGGEK